MIAETLLAYAHIAAVLAWVVFITSQAALARAEWFNGAVVERLVRVDVILWACWALLLLSGLARSLWGVKGAGWYWSQPLLHGKLTLLLALGAASWPNTRAYRRWRAGWRDRQRLPDADDITRVRRRVMLTAHVMLFIPLMAVALARGVGTR